MKSIHIKSVCFVLAVLSLTILGCDSLLEPELQGRISVDQVFGDAEGAITVLNSAYAALADGGGYDGNALISMTELASDNGWTRRVLELKRFRTDPATTMIQAVWTAHYRGIARCNLVLEKAPNVAFEDAMLKDAVLGQARFLRALFYFNLVRLYGAVLLLTEPVSSAEEAAVPRTPIKEVYAQIEKDLQEAAELLPRRYDDTKMGLEKGRATSGAVQALLANVYLTQEKWQKAATTAKIVIDSGVYALLPDYVGNFQGLNENSVESIFEVQFSGSQGATGSSLSDLLATVEVVQGNGLEFVIPTNDTLDVSDLGATSNGIVQAFELGDLRKEVAISTYGLSGHYPLINKYYAGPDASPGNSPINVPVIRYAEVLLVRAEALNEMGQGAEAAALLNEVRARAGLDSLPNEIVSDQGALRSAIWHERRVELCFEFNRFFDLNRLGILAERMAMQGIEIAPAKMVEHPITGKPQYLYPIPVSALTTNPNITQNPGY